MKTGLALSGGGALGAAHIGVLEELEKNKIKIDSVCGTSAGAIIGLLYCYGGVSAVNEFFSEMEKAGLFNRTNIILRRNSLIFSKIEEILTIIVKAKGFSDLKTQFSCIATDITTGEMKHFSLGEPIKAVMASSAYPGVFPVQKIGNNFYVDGGLVKNLPASILKKSGMEFIVGSSLYCINTYDRLNNNGDFRANPLSIALRSLEIMEKQLAESEKTSCDFCFEPPVHSFQWFDFDAVYEIREIGAKNAEENSPELQKTIKRKNHKESLLERIFQ